LSAQNPHNYRSYKIPANHAKILLDSLSIIEESFEIFDPNNNPLEKAFYNINYITSELILKISEFWRQDSLRVNYQVFPVNFSKPYFHKDTSWISLPGPGESFRRLTAVAPSGDKGLLDIPELSSSGSITRGVTVGNNQDLSLNSAMNLQLAGKLTDDIEVLAVISDQDIPLQPEGTTQQLQDFDKVFIQLTGYNSTLTAGDFEVEKPKGHFLNFSRKSQGGMIQYNSKADNDSIKEFLENNDITFAGAISKGIYSKNQFNGINGNQGPYKLSGNNAESFIIVIAGSEKVFIDGMLLTRGMENDYTIDYNQGEITFTSRRLINSSSRITVEFEYASRDYARSMYFTSAATNTKHGNVRINFFSEQDNPSQPLFRELSESQKDLLASVGDSINKAFTWSFDSIGFRNDRAMYLMTDTLGYDTIFVHSTNPEKAYYQVNFTYLGEGKGNYRQIQSSANGRVFQWIAPINGQLQGTHEPIQLLKAPEKSQMLTIAYDLILSEKTSAGVEWAFSNYDKNMFSDFDKKDNSGMGVLAYFKNTSNISSNWNLETNITHETSEKTFTPIERYRSVEFERDWVLSQLTQAETEHHSTIEFSFINKDHGYVKYNVSSFLKGDFYKGVKNGIDTRLKNNNNRVFYQGNYLSASGIDMTNFYRHYTGYTRIFKHFNIGLTHKMEDIKVADKQTSFLKPNSSAFNQSEVFITNEEQKENNFKLFYIHRNDFLPQNNSFNTASISDEYGATYKFATNPNQRLSISSIYRKTEYKTLSTTNSKKDNSVAGRLEYFTRMADGIITSTLFYEIASGMERKREFLYVEVPAGQGAYVWIDYNGNGIMELDEFELSQFPDEANFIRVFIPTDDFVSVFTNIYSHSLNINPGQKWSKESGYKKLLSKFNNQTVFSSNKKIQEALTISGFNPFYISLADTLITSMNTSLRNSLFFNRSNPVYGLELTYRDDRNKILLSNGVESRKNEMLTLTTRWNLSRKYSVVMMLGSGNRTATSEYFNSRNFSITTLEAEPTFNVFFSNTFRVGLFYGHQRKQNHDSSIQEYAIINKAGADSRINFPGKGSVVIRFQLSQIDYPFDENTPIAFDMLESLKPGLNQLWNIAWQQNLNEYLMLIVNYHGRKSPDNAAIHTGNIQIRAFF